MVDCMVIKADRAKLTRNIMNVKLLNNFMFQKNMPQFRVAWAIVFTHSSIKMLLRFTIKKERTSIEGRD